MRSNAVWGLGRCSGCVLSSTIRTEVETVSAMVDEIVTCNVPVSIALYATDVEDEMLVSPASSCTWQELHPTLTETMVPSWTSMVCWYVSPELSETICKRPSITNSFEASTA